MFSANVALAAMSTASSVMSDGLKQRIITAVILLLCLFTATTLFPPFWFALFIAAVVLVASWEWGALIGLTDSKSRQAYLATMILMLIGALLLLGLEPGTDRIDLFRALMVLSLGLVWWSIAWLMLFGYPGNAEQWNDKSKIGLMGLLALIPTWVGIVVLKYLLPSGFLVLGLVIMVAAVDVGAYFAGRAFGSRPLAPSLSPKKTWEGVWGGLATCCVVGALFVWGMHSYLFELNIWQIIVLLFSSLVITVFAVVGDLVESMLKRNSNLKDSGHILPGHGGILDRVDAILAVTPVSVIILLLTLKGGI
jgi:phosphatidate cytidylyltransferase